MPLKVVELFAGVGGFRLGLQNAGGYEVAWFNQWEPSTKAQHAYACYIQNFHPDGRVDATSNQDISTVPAKAIPEHDLLVGGFPCQDYSVASTLDKSKGLRGKKGVLWWEIHRILGAKRPPYVLLENVDRLLRSPAAQRGRDFGILLACMRDLGYAVEWRVLNAADYGFPQKRRRVFIFAARQDTGIGKRMAKGAGSAEYLTKDGFFAGEFPVKPLQSTECGAIEPQEALPSDVRDVSDDFEFHFQNAGVMSEGKVWTQRVAHAGDEPLAPLRNHLRPCSDEAFYVAPEKIDGPRGWRYFRDSKKEVRTAKNGHVYNYAEGAMAFPDPIDQPARTILTGEGGTNPSRSNHAVKDPVTGRIRVLMPEECELLNGFPEGHTRMLPARWRYFAMGNALVVGLVTRMGTRLQAWLAEEEKPRKRRVAVQSR